MWTHSRTSRTDHVCGAFRFNGSFLLTHVTMSCFTRIIWPLSLLTHTTHTTKPPELKDITVSDMKHYCRIMTITQSHWIKIKSTHLSLHKNTILHAIGDVWRFSNNPSGEGDVCSIWPLEQILNLLIIKTNPQLITGHYTTQNHISTNKLLYNLVSNFIFNWKKPCLIVEVFSFKQSAN